MKKFLVFFLGFCFLFPIVHLLFFVSFSDFSFDESLLFAIQGAFLQSILSSSLTLFLAFLSALGLNRLSQKWKKTNLSIFRMIVLVPGFVPPLLFVLLGVQAMGFYPVGLSGVLLFHVLMNVGLIAVLLESSMSSKCVHWASLAEVEGVSKKRFIFRGLLPGLRKEMMVIFLFLFITYFLSFSIPFLVGGLNFGGVEVFIYEKIFLFGSWGEALVYSLSISLFFSFFGFLVPKGIEGIHLNRAESTSLKILSLPLTWVFVAIPPLLIFLGFLLSLFKMNKSMFENMFEIQLQETFILGLGVGISVFFVLSSFAYIYMSIRKVRWFFCLVPPSWILVGFSLFLMGSNQIGWSILKCIFGLTILFVPYLFRLSLFKDLLKLEEQVEVALICGADWNTLFLKIIWPQVLPNICFLSGIAAFWACGDFALTGMVLSFDSTIALQMKNFLMNYKLENALVLLLPLLLVSSVLFALFQGLAYVCRKNILS